MSSELITLTAEAAPELTLAEKLSIGGEVSLMGIAIVFLVLALLWGILELFKVIFYTIPNQKKEKALAASEPASVTADTADEAEEAPDTSSDEELVAAITAAITAYRASCEPTARGGFRVVSFRRK